MRVVVADDHPQVRSAIVNTLTDHGGLEVVAEASSGDEALVAVRKHRPDLLILDLVMPGIAPEQVIFQARELVPDLKTLIVTAYDDHAYVRGLSQVPISGYLLKDEAPDDLLKAVRVIAQGAVWFSPSVAQQIMNLSSQPPERGPTLA